MANFESPDLAFSSKEGYGEDSGLAVYVAQAIDPSLKWEDIAWLKRITSLPVVVKGLLRGERSSWEEQAQRLLKAALWFGLSSLRLFSSIILSPLEVDR